MAMKYNLGIMQYTISYTSQPNHLPFHLSSLIPHPTRLERPISMAIRRSSSLIPPVIHNPTSLCPQPTSSSRSILHIRRLTTYTNRSLSIPIPSIHIRGRRMSRQRIRLLSQLHIAVLRLALPELPLGRPGCVAVVGGWAEGFFFFVVSGEG